MAKRPLQVATLAGALAVLSAHTALANDAASARMLAGSCAGCHGTDGASRGPATPTIAGFDSDYFVEVMKGFKSDEIYGTIMGRIAKGYTDEEIEKMAKFFAAKPYVPAKQAFDSALAKQGAQLHDKYCEKCHSEGGKVVKDDEYHILAGQYTPYLNNAMSDFLDERRPMPKKMKKKVEQLLENEGDKGLAALFAFYASEQ